jgi:hypothetical protein
VSDRRRDPEPEAESSDLDTANEPEPEWAEAIRRGRRERAQRLRDLLPPPDDAPNGPTS